MTDYLTTWDEIYRSLVEDKNNGLSCNRGIVNTGSKSLPEAFGKPVIVN